MNVLDLFCGAGGFSYGFDTHKAFQVTCGVDLLIDRVRSFHLNHPYANAIATDIREYRLEQLAHDAMNPDVVIGGPPCQGFSSIRPFRNLTEGDKRNSLPEQYLLTVGLLRPKWFIFENVVGLMSHKKGSVLRDLIEGLRSLNYVVDWRVINCAGFGVPQNRERVFVVGTRRRIGASIRCSIVR
jgi:DNA (cytosine-5)-methyltransferase 1